MADDPKKYSFDRDALIISAFAFAFGALFAWALIDPPLIQKASKAAANSKPSEWPAWVQAIGSILGIAVAIAIPLRIQQREQQLAVEDKRLRLISYSIAMIPAAESFKGALNRAKNIIDHYEWSVGPQLNDAADFAQVPEELQSRVADLHEVGEPAVPLMRAIIMSARVRSELRQAQFYYDHSGVYQDPYTGEPFDLDEPGEFSETLDACIKQLDAALTSMGQVLS
ncbi:hypothetical protein QSH39_014865 [Xanthomonas arboricola pv. corylina]|uniref:hypothetical protein n=1 Tax=Xanthomonas arboricola TaxID=56448 RepID=UPI0025B27724|nr:hypothetical protein [Xanthomonas arboricola]MDN0202817.1 hypothetical protein [Xanthomonas arboricola pv. corylina]MDN0215370.1 hypothetical protein [Xanthomonas arboricola pv. corylina]